MLIFRYRFERFDDNKWDDDCRLLLKDEVIELIWDNGIVCDILLIIFGVTVCACNINI